MTKAEGAGKTGAASEWRKKWPKPSQNRHFLIDWELRLSMLQRSIMESKVSKSKENNQKPQPDKVYEVKVRKCLMCRDSFESAWPGERVCPKCKQTNLWRAA